MLHNTIKELARRSMSHDRVMFGESNKQHPLGFDGFMIDATVDRALLQLNSSTYDSATSLGVECDNLSRLLRESMNVNVNSTVGKLYRESKVGEIFKKVIAYIKKALKFLFVELPKKVYNKIKSFFTKKKDSAGMAKKTEENIKKTEASIKSIKKEVEAKMTVAAEALKETDELLRDTASHTEAQRDEFEKHKNDTLTRMSDRHAKASEIIQQSIKSMDDNRKRMSDSADRIAALNASLNETEDFNDKTNKIIKKAGKSYANARDTGASEFTDTLKEIDAIGAELDDLLASMDATPSHNDVTTIKYRDDELKSMAETLLSAIESGKAKLYPFLQHEMNFFKTKHGKKLFQEAPHFALFAAGVLLRATDNIPYTTTVMANYIKDKYSIEIFSNSFPGPESSTAKPSAVVKYMYEQIKSVVNLCKSLDMGNINPTFDVEIFNEKYIDAFTRCMVPDGDSFRVSLDALSSISHEMTIRNKKADLVTLKSLQKPYAVFAGAINNMNEAVMQLKDITYGEIMEKNVADGAGDGNDISVAHETMSNITELIKLIIDTTHKISVSALRCVYSLVLAEEKMIKLVVSADDYVNAITMNRLAQYIAEDEKLMERAWAILLKNPSR